MPLAGGLGGLAHPEFGLSLPISNQRGQIMPNTLLIAHPDLKT